MRLNDEAAKPFPSNCILAVTSPTPRAVLVPIKTRPPESMRSLSPPLVSNLKRPDEPDSPLILADVSPQFRPLPFPSVAAPAITNVDPSKV